MNTPASTRPLALESEFCIEQGFELVDYGDGWAMLACDVEPRHTNRHGNAHGGLIAALLDTAMGLATRASGRVENLGTASLTVNYLKPASGRIAVHAHLRRCGRTLAFCGAEARNGADDVVATASAVFSVAPGGA
ncbi:PaaI family thioesterase [Caballeronia glathei]|uniref:ABC transporter substrate-binding protein n=1 Tax=Caballeronia glathei TaxID=60547 RepID=A0A069PCE4_9BURK|nr:PaaI family thioesterase [Caballeronia glathei]KDR38300.1 ABC transporter substrate-binding protein [Caballeronia glathei]